MAKGDLQTSKLDVATTGRRFSHYQILDKVGEGGMGVVFKAEDTKLKRVIALKFLSPDSTRDEEARERFLNEARAAALLNHPNICTIHDIDQFGGQFFIAMEYIAGDNLSDRLQSGPLPVDEAVRLAIQVVEGLDSAHERGIVHSDIKSANIMVNDRGQVKILDFGLARLSGRAELSKSGSIRGTLACMSPEQIRGAAGDPRSDIWSLGVLLYEMVTGRLPFAGERQAAVIQAVLNEPPPLPSEIDDSLPRELEGIILTCLRKDPADRFPSTQPLLTELRRLKGLLKDRQREVAAARKSGPPPQAETERRQATVICAEITGYAEMLSGFDVEESAATMALCSETFATIVEKYCGRIDRVIGNRVMALFGVPIAIEAAPKEAVNAAIEIRNMLQQLNRDSKLPVPLDIHVGISTGMVISRSLGSFEKRDCSIMGDAVLMANQLKDLAGAGQILVGPLTHKYTRDDFAYDALKPVSLKGRSGPVLAFRLLSSREKVQRGRPVTERALRSEMVGREKELDALRLHVLKAVNGQGSIVNVIGEAGIGKSRLVAELGSCPEMKKVTVLKGRSLSIGANLAFHPIIDILRGWAGISDDEPAAASALKLEKAIRLACPGQVAEIFPFIATLMGLKLAGQHARRVEGIEGDALEKLIRKNVRELIVRGAALRPLVIVLEDLHWADLTSVDLLESLYRLAVYNSILFINVLRPDCETSDRLLQVTRSRFPDVCADICLEPLDSGQCAVLIENLLDVEALPKQVRELIADRAEGNPLFLEEVALSLIDNGILERKGRHCRMTERFAALVIPETVHEILMARIDRLDEQTRSLLKIASVIGRNFLYRILRAVAPDVGEIDARLGHLQDVQLIQERPSHSELEYSFRHVLVQEVAYGAILLKDRKELHVRVARAIEELFAGRLNEFYGMLAFHYSHGEHGEKAQEYLVKAGEEAVKAAASSEALHYYQEALDLYLKKRGQTGDPQVIADFEWNIAKALLNKGRMAEAVTHFDRVLAAWGEKRPKNRLLARLFFFINLLRVLKSLYLPSRQIRQVPDERENDMFEATYQRGTALVSIDTQRMVTDSLRFLGKLHNYDLTYVRNGVPIYVSSSALFFFSGKSFAIARKLLDHAKKFIAAGDKKTQLTYSFWEAAFDALAGNWDRDVHFNSSIVDSNLNDGDMFTPAGYLFYSALLVIEQEGGPRAQIYIDKLRQISEVYENDTARTRVRILSVKQLLMSRRLAEAQAEAEACAAWLVEIEQNFFAVYVLGIEAHARTLQGDLEGAERTLERARKLIPREKQMAPFFICTFRLARFFLDLCELEEAGRAADGPRAACLRKKARRDGRAAIENSLKCALVRTEALRLMGTYFWLIGRQKKALQWWRKSVSCGVLLKAVPELGRTYLEIGKRLLEPGSRCFELDQVRANGYIDRARRMLAGFTAPRDMEETQKIIDTAKMGAGSGKKS
jgi:class 3 adenylate cyclase/predicted Ser/Thr protein kinase/tetratricopeptide (TPR) repeat protein